MDQVLRYILIVAIINAINVDGMRIVDRESINGQQKNIVGMATNIVTSNLLKANVENHKNFVFSPIGFSSILAILNEGASGETATDISSLLRHPEDRLRVQSAYRDALKNFNGDNPMQAPQFKTWLYVYKNNSIEPEFKRTITADYFVDVKEIERDYYLTDEPSTEEIQAKSKDESIKSNNSTNSKDIPYFDTLKKSDPMALADETRLIDDQKDASKFDEVIEDRQYVEVPVIKEEISKQEAAAAKVTVEETATVTKSVEPVMIMEAMIPDDEIPVVKKASAEVESNKYDDVKPKIQRQNDKLKSKLEDLEIMKAQESGFGTRKFGESRNDGDGTSGLSGNSLIGDRSDGNGTESKMLLFNGLYYKGLWATPFQQLRFGPDSIFYLSESEKISTKMMRSRGYYKIAELPNLKSQAIELPYENERYSFLILLPNARNGLKSLLTEFTSTTITEIVEQLEEESVDISLPKFSFDTTSGAEKMLTKSGLASIFTSKANFTGITKDQPLHVAELQQHVTVRVDEGSSSENFLTATNALRSNAQPERSIAVDRPFAFFVRDVIDNVIIVAGKLVMPPVQDEPIFAID